MPRLFKVDQAPLHSDGYDAGDIFYQWGSRHVWIVQPDGSLFYAFCCDNPTFSGPSIPGKKRKRYRLYLNEYHCIEWIELKKKKKRSY